MIVLKNKHHCDAQLILYIEMNHEDLHVVINLSLLKTSPEITKHVK